jgi:hypothetical protein
MKIDLQSIDPESFMVHQHFVGEHECFLVQPIHFGAVWAKDNLIYRSSLWDKDGNPVSLSFKKFFNYDEKPDIFPAPSNLTGAKLMEKLDGSTLIFSRYKGQTVIRTRGTVDARKQANGHEIDYLLQKYKEFIEFLESFTHTDRSYVFEWLSRSCEAHFSVHRTRGCRAPFGSDSFIADGRLLLTEFWVLAFTRLAKVFNQAVFPGEVISLGRDCGHL